MKTSKPELRRTMRERLQAVGAEREVKSAAICAQLARLPAYAAAERVAVFDAMPSEPTLEPLWQMAPRAFLFPRIAGEELELVETPALEELIAPGFRGGYREPGAGAAVPLEAIDLVIVPGLAFTRAGGRMGRGGGFYDRLLARLPARVVTVGVCFEMQIAEELPVEPHDLAVALVVTEAGVWP